MAWKRMSLTPAIISVALKYRSAESPPRLRELYTRSATVRLEIRLRFSGAVVLTFGNFSQCTTFLPEVHH